MIELPSKFLDRMKVELGERFENFLASYARPPYKAIRINTLKISVDGFKKISPFALEPVPWENCGFYIDGEKAGRNAYHSAGLYYSQEPSAMSAAPLLNVKPYERVLDMCSAPGGKGTQLAQKMQGKGVIVLNEVDYSRAKILSRNIERLGITNALVTNCSPGEIERYFPEYFDKILVDAPCSGEGMFLKEAAALTEWSPQNVSACAVRQAKILASAKKSLKAGGLLVYSTCTFAPEEDEIQIENFLADNPQFKLLEMHKFLPDEIKGEGHFVALMVKGGESGESAVKPQIASCNKKVETLWRDFEKRNLTVKFENLHLIRNNLYSLPADCPLLPTEREVLRAGVCLGEIKEDRIEPSHSLAMSSECCGAQVFEVDESQAVNYLRGLTLDCPNELKGWALVTCCGHSLGWCKCVNGTAKNHLPKGLRI